MTYKTNNSITCIGTSGWMYKDWGKDFYPPGMRTGFLSFYSQEFGTVEVNSSFYHLPKSSTFTKWKKETPDNFMFAVKMSRYVTHRRRLADCREAVKTFLVAAKRLGAKLGPILIQLPPSMPFNEKSFGDFLTDLARAKQAARVEVLFALEPRHDSWLEEGTIEFVRRQLSRQEIALVFAHSSRIPSYAPVDDNITSSFVYIRFHGPSEFGASQYGARRLAPWAKRIHGWQKRGLSVFAYFNNDANGHAVTDARSLKKLLQKA